MTEPTPARWQSTEAWHELTSGLAELESSFLTGDKAVPDEAGIAAGYRMLATILGVGFDTYLFPDTARPAFVEAVTPRRRDRRWGGDNTDAWYYAATLDPTRTYRVWGRRNDSVYLSLTVYNEPAPGAWSDRVIGVLNDTDLDIAADGSFELVLGPQRPEGWAGPFIELAPDSLVALTRDYQADPLNDTPAEWNIAAVDDPGPVQRSDAEVAQGLRSTLAWMRTMFAIVPIPLASRGDDALGHNTTHGANEFAEPYQVKDTVFGWSATDACYAFGTFALEPDEALVITFRPPPCRFWNLTVWNEFMAGHNAADGQTSINGETATTDADGTVTVVLARTLVDHPNAITTLDLARGNLALRCFLTSEVPDRPVTRLMKLSDVGG